MKLKPVKKIIFALLPLIFAGCADRYKAVDMQTLFAGKDKVKDDTLMMDSAGHFFFSRLARPASFGFTAHYSLPEKQQGKEFYVVFYGKARSNYAQSNSTITLVAHDKENKQLCWKSVFLRPFYTDVNRWCYFRDSLYLPPSLDGKKYAELTSVAFLSNSTRETFDLDTLHVIIKQKI